MSRQRRNRAPIHEGDFILIDIWGRLNQPGSVLLRHHLDGRGGTRAHGARADSCLRRCATLAMRRLQKVEMAFAEKRARSADIEADDAARECDQGGGFGEYFTHRTGHNIAQELHGPGAHLDNLETHDERLILPNTCFSVEPGIYLPEFGVRSEVNMMTARDKAWVTGKIQRELVRI